MKRKLNGIFQNDEVPCYPLGQVGKNDVYEDDINGKEIIEFALNVIMDAHEMVGGRFVSVDCKDVNGLLNFYKVNDFSLLPEKDDHGYYQLVKFL
ncbi:MAG: hypothetical protein LUQ09_00120 [Methanomassiliicoccales archaeon]|nr:hypothetical protein [Methanomassiliicoccales archaeon]